MQLCWGFAWNRFNRGDQPRRANADQKESNHSVRGLEPETNFELRGFSSVGAMDHVAADVDGQSPRMVPGSASRGLVAPISLRALAITPSLQTMATTGPEVMKSTTSKERRSRRRNAAQQAHGSG